MKHPTAVQLRRLLKVKLRGVRYSFAVEELASHADAERLVHRAIKEMVLDGDSCLGLNHLKDAGESERAQRTRRRGSERDEVGIGMCRCQALCRREGGRAGEHREVGNAVCGVALKALVGTRTNAASFNIDWRPVVLSVPYSRATEMSVERQRRFGSLPRICRGSGCSGRCPFFRACVHVEGVDACDAVEREPSLSR